MTGGGPARLAAVRPRFLAALLLGLAAAVYLGFALPVGIYLGNRLEFFASWSQLLAPGLWPTAAAVLAWALFAGLLPERVHGRVMVLAAALVLLAWVQGNLLVWEYGRLDGSEIDFSRGSWRGWLDGALWLAVLLAVDYWRERLVRGLPRAAIACCAISALLVAGSLAAHADDPPPGPVPDEALATLSRFSPRANVLHIVADGMQSGVFDDLLREDRGEMLGDFDGFVFFQDNLGLFPYTHVAVPALLSGRIYDNTRPLPDFLDEAMGRDSILAAARAAGFEVEVGMPQGGISGVYRRVRDGRVMALPSRPLTGEWRGPSDQSLLLVDLSLFRIVPHFAKKVVYNDQQWLVQPLFGRGGGLGQDFLAHSAFLQAMSGRLGADATRPQYKLVHLMLSHRPMVTARDCSYTGRALVPDRENVRNQARCGLRGLRTLLAAMRRQGVYDNSTIVVSGDHGAFVPPRVFSAGSSASAQAQEKSIVPAMIGHARPLLLVKPPRARGPLRRSTAPTWLVDTAATIADAAAIPGTFPGVPALRLPEGQVRERRFMEYGYLRSEWQGLYLSTIQEYLVNGRTDDIRSWEWGRTFPPYNPPPER
jgi:hypothetical protein